MSRIEDVTVIECLIAVHGKLGLGNATDIAELMCNGNAQLSKTAVINCLRGKHVSESNRPTIAKLALDILATHYDAVMSYLDQEDIGAKAYMRGIIRQYRGELPKPDEESKREFRFAHTIFRNWRNNSQPPEGYIGDRIYQLFRRYKPTGSQRPDRTNSTYDWSCASNHVVVCELIYIDSKNMECTLITAESNIYIGTIFINDEGVSYGILQRRAVRKDGSFGTNHRFIAMKHERHKKLPMYSGLCLKTGDTFRRPVAAECLYVQISRSHSLLYKAFADLRKEINGDSHSGRDIEVASAIQEYISENQPAGPPYNPQNPSSEWRRVKFVRDFPMLDRMAKKEDGIPLFREPLRTISDQTIVSLCNEFDMRPFRFESQDSPREPQGASNKPPPGP